MVVSAAAAALFYFMDPFGWRAGNDKGSGNNSKPANSSKPVISSKPAAGGWFSLAPGTSKGLLF
jgi:hypothetical protein